MTIELVLLVFGGLAAVGTGIGAGVAAVRGKRNPPRSGTAVTINAAGATAQAAPSAPMLATDTGRWEPSRCPDHSAIVQRHAASEARLERIESKLDGVSSALSRLEGALGTSASGRTL